MLAKTTERADIFQMNMQTDDSPPLVLVVEDHEGSRFMLKTLLEIWGYRVAESADGENSIAVAVSKCPDLILMNISLSKNDGLSTMCRMREIDALRSVPIIFISGHAQPEFRSHALALGGNDFLVKPVDFSRLETLLKKFIEKKATNINLGGYIS